MKDLLNYFKSMQFSFEWGERASLWLNDFSSYPFTQETDLPWIQTKNSIQFVINPDTSGSYSEKAEFEERGKKHAAYFMNKDNIRMLWKKYQDILTQLQQYLTLIEKTDFSNFSKEQLLPYFKEFVRVSTETTIWYRATNQGAEYYVSKKIKEILAKYFEKNKIDEVFHTLSLSSYSNPIKEEKEDWIILLKKEKPVDDDFYAHIKKYSMFYTNIYTHVDLMKTIKSQYHLDKPKIKQLEKEQVLSQKNLDEIKGKQKALLEKITNDDLSDYLMVFQRFGEYRFRLKPGYAGIEVLSLLMLSRIGELAGMSVHDLHELLTIQDLFHFLETGKLPTQEILEQRKKCRVIAVHNKKMHILQGEEGIDFINKTIFKKERNLQTTGILQGMIACQGLVRGKVRVILSTKLDEIHEIEKTFQQGDILVTHNTQPNMVPLMKKAGAIVTAQGGIISHSAIVSREFNIPCIVGIDSVTLYLKDGDYIEVDATKGIVRKLG